MAPSEITQGPRVADETTHPVVAAPLRALHALFHAPNDVGTPGHSTVAETCWQCNRAAAVAAPVVLRWYADEHHHFGGGSGPRWAGSEPLEPDAWCACGASWCEDGCTERETLLAIAAEIERASGSPEGRGDQDE